MQRLKKRMPTSKFLVYIVTWAWVFVVIFSCFSLLKGLDSANILITVSSSFGIILNGFFLKSYFENKEQNKNLTESSVQIMTVKQKEHE